MRSLPALAAAVLLSAGVVMTPVAQAQAPYQVLVFSKTAGFRHDAIPAGIQAIRDLGAANGFTVTATEDAAAFTATGLAKYSAVVFLSTTGDVLDGTQQTAFESYVNGGGGFVGVHAAADTEYDWPYYGQLVGAYFSSHPNIQQVNVKVEDRAHPATAHLGPVWTRTDELYNYRANPRPNAHVLATLDESSYSGGTMGADHPIAWCKAQSNGRAFYTGLGHTIESYSDPVFRAHLLGGIRYAAGVSKADCRPETGYTGLYTGSTAGWSQAGPGGFGNADGTLTSQGGPGNFWYSAKEFGSYSLKLDWKLTGDGDSGVHLGFPSSGAAQPGAGGYEIAIDASAAANATTGAVYGVQAPDATARDAALNPAGQWNTFELLVEGERLRVYLNGRQVNDFTNTDAARSLRQGYIGLQNLGDGATSFRNVRIKELGVVTPTQVQGEAFTSSAGVQVASHATAVGGQTLGYIENGDWAAYSQVSTTGARTFTARVSSGGAGGRIEVRSGSSTGTLLGSVAVVNTGGFDTFATVSTALTGTTTGQVVLVFTGATSGGLFDVDHFTIG
ncbi:ThuA domain-containing protein [Umezawaea sp. Da 62-37]|uniref:ThuA domain-containing protein n=1 Tax=Umezawaea sp. Da 62-37 TaxID=3075927 RepID=UPI0037DC4E55